MAKLKLTTDDYKARLKVVRRFTKGFDAASGYDLRSAQNFSSAKKAQINKYFETLRGVTARAHYDYRPRNKSHLKSARDAAGLPHLKKLNVVPIQVPTTVSIDGKRDIIKPQISFTKKGAMRVKIGSIDRDHLMFEELGYTLEQVAQDPAGVINEITANHPYAKYTVIAGEHEVGKGVPRFSLADTLAERVKFLVEKYGADKYDPNNESSSYFGNWLQGVIGYNFPRPAYNAELNYKNAVREYQAKRLVISKEIKKHSNNITKTENKIKKLKRTKKLSPEIKHKRIKAASESIKKSRAQIGRLIVKRSKL